MNPRVPVVVLVHGAAHGGWCWQFVREGLARAGVPAIAPDLPGHGARVGETERASMRAYADEITALVAGIDRPAVLVGHSMAGQVIARVALDAPDRIRRLVFLSGQVLEPGMTALDTLPPRRRADYLARARERGGLAYDVAEQTVRELWLNTLAKDDPRLDWVLGQITPQPLRPLTERAAVAGFRRLAMPIDYLWPRSDRSTTAGRMRTFVSRLPSHASVRTLPGDHDIMVSAPDRLIRELLRLTQAVATQPLSRTAEGPTPSGLG
ncbi:pimeloyl-ACP methyl ester carboxylesterase [Naumannella cuiyingiana]|uniref:Pimeloyl-ACP methyl ester carboxylesterase n=1 Tax=Naumannella cuiyingiana TaxID=1347891 RepID=A0A7Z0D701_9ACTN|nr:alpha/beta hydrolase [Naumannella cuiyingiana]NYI70046.1 pimeloyl-ACP methyl ester carboxylesterase [Naumannella cuiyingiana]